MLEEAQIASQYIKAHFKSEIPKTAVILGSGLGNFTKIVKIIKTIKYHDIPSFPQSHVAGHKGNLTLATIEDGRLILIMEGRFHYYEGYTPQQVAFPIVVFHLLGIKTLIVSNAAGGINPSFTIGDLMIIDDHINFFGAHPLTGKNNDQLGPRFLDQTEPYNKKLIDIAHQTAVELGIKPQQGVYIGLSGPTYETRAEIKAFGVLGADAVGMSTIFEVMMANYFKMNVLGISSITNMATGISKTKHEHQAVVDVANTISDKFSAWVKKIIQNLP
jgi:purine-nucleoside phosphorylase